MKLIILIYRVLLLGAVLFSPSYAAYTQTTSGSGTAGVFCWENGRQVYYRNPANAPCLRRNRRPNPPAPQPQPSDSGAAERERIEGDRRAAEEARRREEEEAAARRREEEERKEKFEREKSDALESLKGIAAGELDELKDAPNDNKSSTLGLKGVDGSGSGDLKLKEGSGSPNRKQAALRQVLCAASIFKYALDALQIKGDYEEYGTLSVEAMKALDGKPVEVECKPAPSVLNAAGPEVDVDKLRSAEKELIVRANGLAQRMKESSAAAPSPRPTSEPPAKQPPAQPCTGSEIEKLRCTQAQLNEINDKKVTGQTKEEISEQEKNRKELADLVLINNGLEKGELITVSVDTSEETAPSPRRKKPVPAPNPQAPD